MLDNFVVFEGCDGSGTNAQIELLHARGGGVWGLRGFWTHRADRADACAKLERDTARAVSRTLGLTGPKPVAA